MSGQVRTWLSRRLVEPARRWLGLLRGAAGACLRGVRLTIAGKAEDAHGIKAFYQPRRQYLHFDARTSTERPQDRVYQELSRFFADHDLKRVVDVGCGTGFKLVKYFGQAETLGLERPPILETLAGTYPGRRWQLADFDHPPGEAFDMAISVDVIEHLVEPDDLMRFLQAIDCRYVGLSTPDRDRLGVESRIGPPANVHHMREWSHPEFVRYVSRFFRVLESKVVSGHELYVICEKP